MKVKDFKAAWRKIKKEMTEGDEDFFYNVVNIDNTIGRSLGPQDYLNWNSRFSKHYFPTNRCHWNVIFPCYLLNERERKGKFKIISSGDHSAIINTETFEIYDPTYMASGIEKEITLERLKGFTVYPLELHIMQVDKEIHKRFVKWFEPGNLKRGRCYIRTSDYHR